MRVSGFFDCVQGVFYVSRYEANEPGLNLTLQVH